MHCGYTGPARCLTDKKEEQYCGGPTYEFEFSCQGETVTSGFGDEDIIREISGPDSPASGKTETQTALVRKLLARVIRLEKQVKQLTRKKNGRRSKT